MLHINRMNKQSGFTLIEVLAAFIVFSLIFTVVMHLTMTSLKKVVKIENYNQAALWANTMFAKIHQSIIIEKDRESGRFNEQFTWELESMPYETLWPLNDDVESSIEVARNPSFELIRLRLRVFWNEERKQAEFTTLLSRKVDL